MTDATDVLRETVTRVEGLTEDITNVTQNISVNATRALENLRPLAQRANGGGAGPASTHRQAIQILQDLQIYTSAIQQARPVIEDGVLAAGTQVFGKVWSDLDATLEEFTSGERKDFYGLYNEMQDLHSAAEQSLIDALRSDAQRVFSYPGPAEREDVASLADLLQLSNVRKTTKQANVVIVNHIRQAATQATGSQQVETTAGLNKFRNFKKQYLQEQQDLLAFLFPEAQATEYLGLIDEIFQGEEAQLTKKVTRLSQGKQKSAMSAIEDLESMLQYDPESGERSVLMSKVAKELKDVYASTDVSVRSQKIDTEVAIAGATDRVAIVIRDYSKRSVGVEAALSNVAPRSYLPNPAPEWVKGFPLKNEIPNMADLFHADLLENLLHSISVQNKKLGRSSWQQGLNMLVNTSFLQHFIEKIELVPQDSLLFQRIEKYHKQGMKLYLNDWQRLSQYLMDPTQTKPGAKLTGKDRDAVKERFKQFNAEFEILVDKQRKSQIPDKQLKQEVTVAISKTIRPLYQRFYDKHSGGDFTKNLDKYLKYDMKRLDEIISTL